MKQYLPVTYVNIETGEIFNKKQLKNKLFKRHEQEFFIEELPWGTYIHTTVKISDIREIPKQGQLFD